MACRNLDLANQSKNNLIDKYHVILLIRLIDLTIINRNNLIRCK